MTAPAIKREGGADDQPRPPSPRSAGAWPVAVRLAYREVRQRLGRTLLVMLLVLVPVAAMTVGSVLIRSDFDRPDQATQRLVIDLAFEERLVGQTDQASPAPSVADVEAIVAGAGDGFEMISMTSVYSDLQSVDGTVVDLRLTEFADSQTGELAFDSGHVPRGPDEVVLSRSVAEAFDVETGDRLRLAAPQREWTVVGVARSRSFYGADFVYVGEIDRDDVRPGRLTEEITVLVDPDVGDDQMFALSDRLTAAGAFHYFENADENGLPLAEPAEERTVLAWAWVAGVVSLLVVGVVIAAAFATSARRQLVTVGQLAANGAPPEVVRRSLALQGSWSGLFGAAVGIGLGLLTVAVAWPWYEEIIGRDLSGRRILAIDLLAIGLTAVGAATIAAALPARTAAKVPVLTALAGRRPVGQVPVWVGPSGGLATAVGFGLLVLAVTDGSNGNAAALASVLGCVLIGAGLVCSAPLLIEAVGRFGGRASGPVRLAARSLARQRSRSAPVVAAISVVMALTTALLTGLRVSQADDELWQLESRYLLVQADQPEPGLEPGQESTVVPLPPEFDEQLVAALPDADRIDVRSVAVELDSSIEVGAEMYWRPKAVVADDETIDLLGLDDEGQRVLAEHGLAWVASIGQSTYQDPVAVAGIRNVPVVEVDRAVVWTELVVTEEWVSDRGLETFVFEVVYDNGRPQTDEELRAIRVVGDRFDPWGSSTAFISVAEAAGIDPVPPAFDEETPRWWIGRGTYVGFNTPWRLIQSVALGVAFGVVLMVIAIGLGLSAVESRDERSVLFVSGARPSVINRVAAIKAGLVSGVAAVVAVPVGYVVVWVIRSLDQYAATGTPVPKLALLGLTVVVPVAATLVTWLTTAALNRFRPVTASSMSDV